MSSTAVQEAIFQECSVKDLLEDDIIVIMMGPTGTGKSNFIERAVEDRGVLKISGSSLTSVTQKVVAIRVTGYGSLGNRLVLVDTPGFDDTHMSDVAVLQLISSWLENSYKRQKVPTALLYFHRISDNRMSGAPYKALRLFGKICGESAKPRIIVVTTMWDKMQNHSELAEQREMELKTSFWKDMIDNYATDQRFHNSSQSAKRILRLATEKAVPSVSEHLLHQEERVDLQLHLGETQAGQTLYSELQKHIFGQIQTLESLRQRMKDPRLTKELEKEEKRLQTRLHASFEQAGALKVSFARKLLLHFRGRAKNRSINIE